MGMAIQPIAAAHDGKSAEAAKVAQAAQEFEAILIQSFMAPLAKTFSTLPGGNENLGMNGYEDLGTQALASGMAKAGGFGMADMIVRNLLRMSVGTGGPNGTQGFSPYVDSNCERSTRSAQMGKRLVCD